MTEFEELALKKITKDYLVDCIYNNINSISGKYDISNAEISTHIGWDPAGFNQKYNRSNDLRITTFIKIYVALTALIAKKEAEIGLDTLSVTKIRLDEFIAKRELDAGELFIHIGDAAEGRMRFLDGESHVQTYKAMRPFVLVGRKNNRFSDRELEVYISYYRLLSAVGNGNP